MKTWILIIAFGILVIIGQVHQNNLRRKACEKHVPSDEVRACVFTNLYKLSVKGESQ